MAAPRAEPDGRGVNEREVHRLGRREEAIPLYRTYLQWRAEPEGVFVGRAERARQALARLAGET